MKRSAFLLIMLAFTAVLASLFFVHRRPVGIPQAFERPTLDSLINIHGSPEQGLKVCGRKFLRVRGAPPYFIGVTNTDLILFSCESATGAKILVICNTNECSFREVPLGQAVFGNQIGYCAATKGDMGDTIESIQSNRVALLSKGFRYVERSILDLSSNTIQIVEVQSERN